jgi:hypothetical protein
MHSFLVCVALQYVGTFEVTDVQARDPELIQKGIHIMRVRWG